MIASVSTACASAPRKTTVLSFQDLDCSDCGEDVARALIERPDVYKTAFDKRRVELTVIAAPSLDVVAVAKGIRCDEDTWRLVPGAGKGRYIEAPKPATFDVLEVGSDGADVPSLSALAVPGKITIVDLFAKWCGPCHELDAHIVETLGARADVAYRRLDVGDWDTPLGERWLQGVKELPYVLVFDPKGNQVAALVGLDLPKFDAAVEAASR